MIGQWKASDQGGQGICLKIGYHGCPFFQKPENCKKAYISTLPYYNQYYQKMKIFTSIISIKNVPSGERPASKWKGRSNRPGQRLTNRLFDTMFSPKNIFTTERITGHG
jgi:hypothetical protein